MIQYCTLYTESIKLHDFTADGSEFQRMDDSIPLVQNTPAEAADFPGLLLDVCENS